MNKVETTNALSEFVKLNENDLRSLKTGNLSLYNAMLGVINAISNRYGDTSQYDVENTVAMPFPLTTQFDIEAMMDYIKDFSRDDTDLKAALDQDLHGVYNIKIRQQVFSYWFFNDKKTIYLPASLLFLLQVNLKALALPLYEKLEDYKPYFPYFLEGETFWNTILQGGNNTAFDVYYDNIDFYNMFFNFNGGLDDSEKNASLNNIVSRKKEYGGKLAIYPAFYRNLALCLRKHTDNKRFISTKYIYETAFDSCFMFRNAYNNFTSLLKPLGGIDYFMAIVINLQDSVSPTIDWKLSSDFAKKEYPLLSIMGVDESAELYDWFIKMRSSIKSHYSTQGTKPSSAPNTKSTTTSTKIPDIPNYNDKNFILKPITNWSPDWKLRGMRPSPTRSASAITATGKYYGLGNNGEIYELATNKRGVQAWKKVKTFERERVAQGLETFGSPYDYQLLLDQLANEMNVFIKGDFRTAYDEARDLFNKVVEQFNRVFPQP
jgi:hypothetical protein